MNKLLYFLLCFPLIVNAQTKEGINFQETLNWQQVKAKAKSENKYIFIDCFTTWCGPCKKMDKEVYINDTVGSYFNDKFISVKVQMDKTNNDNPIVKTWYSDAIAIGIQYKIQAYPALLFLTPEGTIVTKETGFQSPTELIAIAKSALTPGKVYDNPYAGYDSLVSNYRQGKKSYPSMLYMIKTSSDLGDTSLNKELRRDYYYNYLANLKEDDLITRENIGFITSFINSKSRFFYIFFPDGKKVDKIINKKGYAESIVDQVILHENIEPFIQIKVGGMQLSGAKVESKPEPNWYQLFETIKNKYGENYANRNVLEAQIIWHKHQENYSQWIKYFIHKYNDYGIDTTDDMNLVKLNEVAWEIFQRSTDIKQIDLAIQWVKMLMRKMGQFHPMWKAAITDTYASLLYKSGIKKEAIYWQEKAVNIAVDNQVAPSLITEFKDRLDQMKKGNSTWIVE